MHMGQLVFILICWLDLICVTQGDEWGREKVDYDGDHSVFRKGQRRLSPPSSFQSFLRKEKKGCISK